MAVAEAYDGYSGDDLVADGGEIRAENDRLLARLLPDTAAGRFAFRIRRSDRVHWVTWNGDRELYAITWHDDGSLDDPVLTDYGYVEGWLDHAEDVKLEPLDAAPAPLKDAV